MMISFLRTLILYAVIAAAIRLMGKRQVGELQNSELVITLLISNLAAIPMQETGTPLASGLIPIIVLVACEILISAVMVKNRRLRNLICGHPVVVIYNGKILQHHLNKLRLTIEDLSEALRLKDVFDISTVQFAIVETNGQLSVYLKPEEQIPSARDLSVTPSRNISVVVISNGNLGPSSLQLCGKNPQWVEQQLKKKKTPLKDVFLMTADQAGNVSIVLKDSATPSKGESA